MAKILHVVHQFPPEAMGGVEVSTLELGLAQQLRGHELRVLHAVRRAGRPQYSMEEAEVSGLAVLRMVQNYPYRPLEEETWDPAAARRLREVIAASRPDVIHLQHLWGWSAAALQAAIDSAVPTVVHLHDHWLVCPSGGQRYRHDAGVCEDLAAAPCDACYDGFRAVEGPLERWALRGARVLPGPLPPDLLHRGFARLPGRARDWIKAANARLPRRCSATSDGVARRRRERFLRHLDGATAVLSPSRDLARRMAAQGVHRRRIRHLPNGTAMAAGDTPLPGLDRARPLRLLFLGTPAPHKGLGMLGEAVRRAGRQVELHVRGAAPAPALRRALDRAGGRVHLGGPATREEIPGILDAADLLCLPSLWPENAPLVLLEARARRRPSLVSDLGGSPETGQGLVLPAGDVDAWTGALRRLAAHRDRLAELARGITPPRDISAVADDVDQLYRDLGVMP